MPPPLPDLQIAKSKEELKEEEDRRKKLQAEGKASADPRDPRNDPNTPHSMEDLDKMTKWMTIPQLWKELPKKRATIMEPNKKDLEICKEI